LLGGLTLLGREREEKKEFIAGGGWKHVRGFMDQRALEGVKGKKLHNYHFFRRRRKTSKSHSKTESSSAWKKEESRGTILSLLRSKRKKGKRSRAQRTSLLLLRRAEEEKKEKESELTSCNANRIEEGGSQGQLSDRMRISQLRTRSKSTLERGKEKRKEGQTNLRRGNQ